MTQDDIITLPNPHLRTKSQKVGLITPEIQQVIENMKSALVSWDQDREHEVGVGLAAVQIDRLYKVVIVRNDYDNKNDNQFIVFINPSITKYEGDVEKDFEGCLSVKDIYGKVPRYSKVRVKALNEQGREFRINLEGFWARLLQHEVDHTQGIVFIDHIKDDPEAFYRLSEDGSLQPLDYATEIKDNKTLWFGDGKQA